MNARASFGRVIVDETDNIILRRGHALNLAKQRFTCVTRSDYEESLQSTGSGSALEVQPYYDTQCAEYEHGGKYVGDTHTLGGSFHSCGQAHANRMVPAERKPGNYDD